MNEPVKLSPVGQTRREQMLDSLRHEVRRVDRQRRRNRVQRRAAVLLLLGVPLLWLTWAQAKKETDTVAESVPVIGSEVDPFSDFIAETRPEIASDYVVSNSQYDELQLESLSDEQLLQLLAEQGQPSDLVQIDGKTIVVPSQPSL